MWIDPDPIHHRKTRKPLSRRNLRTFTLVQHSVLVFLLSTLVPGYDGFPQQHFDHKRCERILSCCALETLICRLRVGFAPGLAGACRGGGGDGGRGCVDHCDVHQSKSKWEKKERKKRIEVTGAQVRMNT